jgi:outer membrane protein OmpA-like peptidoglycan-associated protein
MRNTWCGMVMSVALAAAVTGCTTRAGKGAAVGGVSGAVLGAGAGAAAGGTKGAAIGAGVGAAAGAGAGALIGRYMDRQAAAMKNDVKSAQVERQGDKVVVRFNSQILFDTNEAELKPESKTDLIEFAKVLTSYPDTVLLVEGHTDSTGPRDFNAELSMRRATTVIGFLEAHGVARGRMTPKGYADSQPVASNTTAYGRRENRRVQIEIAPSKDLQERAAGHASTRPASGRTTAIR